MSAYACEPEKGSEPGVGWNWAQQMGRYHEVWVITRANNRASIEKALAVKPLPNVHWVYFDLPRWARFWKKKQRGMHLYYYLWQIGAYFVVRKLHRRVGFDLVHHVTFVNYWMPSYMALLPAPFVWGPVGGGESAPRSFWRSFSFRGRAYELLRDLARSLAQFDPFVRLAARRATVKLATTPQTEKRLRALGCRNVLIHPAVGLMSEEMRTLSAFPLRQGDPFRFFSIGGLLHLKGFDLGLRAFARFQARFPATEYWIIGDGPERKRLEKLADNLGLAGKVRFWGAVPRAEVLEKLADCDVLVNPSLHDSGGWVCLEAMAAGRPVICLDLGGPALQVTEETGIKIPAISPSQAIADLSVAMEELARDPARRARLGQAGRARVSRLYNWEEKGKYLADLYDQAVSAKLQGELRPPLRILISAYACEPEKGSEPGVGWNWVRQIARFHEVRVITRGNNRASIEKSLAKEPLPNVHWVYFDLPRWARFWKKGQRGVHLYYYLWQIGAYFVVRKLHRRVGFNLVHHVTFMNYWMPSFLFLLPIPFIWGPVGGGESAPRSFWRTFSFRGKAYELLRDLARFLAQFDPFVRLAARRATVGIATTEESAARLRSLGYRKVMVLSSVGSSKDEIARLNGFTVRQSNPFRLVSIGNLLHWKGFELSLRGFARFQSRFPATEYWIIGDGPERKRLRKLAQRLGVTGSVTFWGAIPRRQVLEKLADCDVLVHPSFHDSGASVCLEAMAAGRPVICLDLGGSAVQVTEETGIKVSAITPDQALRDLANAFYKLASDPELRARLSLGAIKRVEEHFNWDKRGLLMTRLYESLSTVEEDTAVERKLSASRRSADSSSPIRN
jgi:glycosyltransferase involved in cell wall biosynthesis